MTFRLPRAPRPLVLLALLALRAGHAAAQNADGILLGMEAATTGGAVLATAGDPATAFYNPAGLAAVDGPSVQFSASAYSVSTMRLGHFVDTTLPWTTAEQSVRASSLYSVPAVAAYGLRLRDGLGVAAGVWVPSHDVVAFASELRTEGPWAPGGSVTRATYEQHLSLSQKLDRTYFGAAAGMALRPGVRVGLSGFVTYDAAEEFVSLFAVATTDSPVPAERGATASVTSSGAPTQLAFRFGAGAQWEVSPALVLAFAAKTPSLAFARSGTVSTIASATSLLPVAPPAIAFVQDRGAPLRLAEPWRLSAGGAVAAGAWSLRAEADWQAAVSGRQDVVNARLGALHRGADVRWGAGLFTDRSGADPGTGALAVDFYGATAGVSLRPWPVRAARRAGGAWDVWTSVAVRYATGRGEARGLAVAPLGGGGAPPTASVRVDDLTVSLGGLVRY